MGASHKKRSALGNLAMYTDHAEILEVVLRSSHMSMYEALLGRGVQFKTCSLELAQCWGPAGFQEFLDHCEACNDPS